MDDNIRQIICDYLNSEASREDEMIAVDYLKQHPEDIEEFRQMAYTWALASSPVFSKEENGNLSRIHKRISMSYESSRLSYFGLRPGLWMKIAAVVVPLLFLATNLYWYLREDRVIKTYTETTIDNEVSAPEGSVTNVVLPDGTQVTLNSGTVLKYQRTFGIKDRIVSIQGEGFFKVARNPSKPFVLHTGSLDVKVLGTTFNVSAYGDEDNVEVSLLEGKVSLSDRAGIRMSLFPNEKAIYNKRSGKIDKQEYNVKLSSSWLDNEFTFENESFQNLAKRLERKFHTKILIESNSLRNENYTGSFKSNISLEEILHEIDIEQKYSWRYVNGNVIISDRK